MEPTNQPPVALPPAPKEAIHDTVVEFLPDADEIERSPLPRLAQLTLHVLVAALIAFLIWASLSEVERVVAARGRLVTPLSNIVVQPLETAIIQSLDVRIGQIVKKGDTLATLDPTFTSADEAQLRTRLHSLETEAQRLEAELAGDKPAHAVNGDKDSRLQADLSAERKANYAAQLNKLSESVARLRAGIETNRRDQDALAEQLKPLKEMEDMQEKLVSRNFGPRAGLLVAQKQRLEVERDMRMTGNREQELKRELAAVEAEKDAFEKGWRQKTMEDLLSVSRDRDSVREQLQKADKRQKLVTLAAPADAVVLDIAKLSQGSVARGTEALFTLVPLDARLEAEVQIDSLDVGYVKRGDDVHIKLDAFPFQRHGTLSANVRTISEDAFRRDAQGQGLDAYYLSRIELGDIHLKNLPKSARLLPGMTLTAEIVVGKRSVLSYLVWPLTRALDESIREP